MNLKENKLEIGIALSAFALVCGLGQLFKQPVQKTLDEAGISYEMPRPKNSILAALFNLDDREIEKKYINPFDKKKNQAKIDETKKAVIPVKSAQNSQKKNPQSKPASPSSLPDFRSPSVDVMIVGGGVKSQLNAADISFGGGARGGVQTRVAGSDSKVATDDLNEQSADKKSAAQWRALIMAQPTLANVQSLKEAFNEGDIDSASYYAIVQDLLSSNTYETQKLGIVALEGIYSVQAFTVAVRSQSQLEEAESALIESYLASYAVSSRLGVLASAMKSQDSSVVSVAIQVTLQGYQTAQSGVTLPTSGGGRDSRGDRQGIAASNYAQFVPIFQQLARSGDSEIAQLASQGLNQIQVSVASL